MRARLTLMFALLLLLPGLAAAEEQGQDLAVLADAAPAAEAAAATEVAAEGPVAAPAGFAPVDARDVTLAQYHWIARPVVVFADSPADPLFGQQLRYLEEGWTELAARDVVIIVDTDPAARSDARQRLRPRGFSLVFVDKDGDVKQRKPQPWTARELIRAIDRTPLRRQEMLEEAPAGR
jgi:hypothetical protein